MDFFTVDRAVLSHRLSAAAAVQAFRDLLFATSRRGGVPITNVSISLDINVADGGVDASIIGGTAEQLRDPLLAPETRFQLKTGTSAAPWQQSWVNEELFGRNRGPAPENLGAAVRRCLDEAGRYVLACFGMDLTDEQIRQARDNLALAFRQCGYSTANVEVWGQSQLVGLFNEFPGLCLRLTGRDAFGFRCHESWASAADMRPPFRVSPEHQELIEAIRSHLRTGEVRHIRLIGEPGVGKTRLALEATRTDDLAGSVVYVPDGATFQRSGFLNELIQPDDHRTIVLVIDECLPKDRASIWNLLSAKSDRIRLITVDHGPDTSGGGGMLVIQVPPTDRARLTEIIGDYGIDRFDAERWAAYCEGCPRVAHVVGENLRQNSSDVLQSPSTVDVWDRFIVGHDDPTSENVELRKVVLRHVAIFERFGFERPVDEEAQFIAAMAAGCDPRLTWQRFQSIVKELRDRRVLQGATTLYLTPRLLHLYLFREFWERYGRGVDLAQLLQTMPRQLWRWFVELLRYAHTSRVASAAVDQLLGRRGLFPDRPFPDSRPQGTLIMALAETNPLPTLRCLQRTIGAMDDEQLLRFREARQSIVWALERLAVWDDCFIGAAELLLKLAETENATNSNNATGTFVGLFTLIPGMGATQAAPHRRLAVLRSAIDAPSRKRRQMALGACKSALSTYGGHRVVGPEHQGLRKTVEFWRPKTYGELWSAYEEVWNLLVAKLNEWKGEDREDLIRTLIDTAWSTLHIPRLTSAVIATLESLADDPAMDIKALVEFVKRQVRHREDNVSEETAIRLRVLSERLNGHDFRSKLRRFAKHVTFEDSLDDDDKHSRLVETKLDELAREAIGSAHLLEPELSWLVCEDSSAAFHFAFRLGKLDPRRQLVATILRAQEQAGEKATPTFFSGYLAAIYEDNPDEWEQRILELSATAVIRHRFSDFVISSGMTDNAARRVVQLCRAGDVDASRLERWWFATRLRQLSEAALAELIELQLSDDDSNLWPNAVQMCHTYFLEEGAERKFPEDLLFRVLTHPGMSQERHRHATSYYWARLAAAYLQRFPARKWDFFTRVLIASSREWSVLADLDTTNEQIMTNILKSDPEEAWDCISDVLGQVDDDRQFWLEHWLAEGSHRGIHEGRPGPIQYIPTGKLFGWIDADVKERGSWIAGTLYKSLDHSQAGRQTRDFIAKYSRTPEIASALIARFWARAWSGPASEHFRALRDEARTWLINENDPTVIRWVEDYIDGLTRDIDRAEIDEEREL